MSSNSLKLLLKIVAVLVIILLAGPEFGVGLELLAILDVMGAELFLLSFVIGFRALPIWGVFRLVIDAFEKIDPYFFIPSGMQIRSCPGMVAHALPGFVCAYLVLLSGALEGASSGA